MDETAVLHLTQDELYVLEDALEALEREVQSRPLRDDERTKYLSDIRAITTQIATVQCAIEDAENDR